MYTENYISLYCFVETDGHCIHRCVTQIQSGESAESDALSVFNSLGELKIVSIVRYIYYGCIPTASELI